MVIVYSAFFNRARRGATAEAAAMMEKFLSLVPAGSAQAEAGRRYLAAWRNR